MSAGVEGVHLLDCGKAGEEHFEFNRGLIEALAARGVPVTFHAFPSMVDRHRTVANHHVAFRSYAMGGLEKRLSSRLARFLTKLGSVKLAFQTALTSAPLVVAYAPPISHVLLALSSRWRHAPTTVFLHAEVEFLAAPERTTPMVGERLMMLALRLAGPRMRYLMLTTNGVDLIRDRRCTDAHIEFCPHPMSPLVFEQRPPVQRVRARAGAFAMVKKADDIDAVRRLMERLPEETKVCRFNGDGLIAQDAVAAGTLIQQRRFLSRSQLESELYDARFFLFPPDPSQYRLTASGLACSAAAAGAHVVGEANAFMRCYSSLYPAAFSVVGHQTSSPRLTTQDSAVDNLQSVAQVLLNVSCQKGASEGDPRHTE